MIAVTLARLIDVQLITNKLCRPIGGKQYHMCTNNCDIHDCRVYYRT